MGRVICSLDFETVAALDRIWEGGKKQGSEPAELIAALTGTHGTACLLAHPSVTTQNYTGWLGTILSFLLISMCTLCPSHSLLLGTGKNDYVGLVMSKGPRTGDPQGEDPGVKG